MRAMSSPLSPASLPQAQTRDYLALLHRVLTVFYLLLIFVGTQPFPSSIGNLSERAEGDALNRITSLAVVLLSLPLLWHYRREALACLRKNIPLYLVVGIALASIVWSQFPLFTLKRSILLLFFTIGATAIAAGTKDLRDFHNTLFIIVAGVAVVDFVSCLVWPGQTNSESGFRGLHLEKNGAGLIAMLGVVVISTWIFAARTQKARLFGIAILLIQLAFLVMTKSKTVLGLTLIALPIGFIFMMAKHLGRKFVLVLIAGGFLVSSAGVFSAMIFNFNGREILNTLVDDPTFTGRDELWKFAYRTAMKRPLLGYGYGAFWDVGEANDPLRNEEPGMWLGDVALGIINEAHNGYLELWLHIGLPAMLLAVLSVLMSLYSSARRATEVSAQSRAGPAYAAIAMVLFLYLLHNSMEANMFIRGMPFCSLALVLALLARNDPLFERMRSLRS